MPSRPMARQPGQRKTLAVLCLVAVVTLLCLQAAHVHNGKPPYSYQSDCSVCVGLRVSATALCVVVLLFGLPTPASYGFPVSLDPRPESRESILPLFIRPPPAAR